MNSKHGQQIKLRPLGDVYLPGKFADEIEENAPFKLFGSKELDQLNRIFRHLRGGGIAVTSGRWSKIIELFSYLEKKKRELPVGQTGELPLQTKAEKRQPTYRRRTKHWYERHYQIILSRVMVIASENRLPYIEPEIHIPYLLELLGEPPGANSGLPFLVPVSAIQKIQADMERSYYISALEGDIISHSNVLQPLSQDTIELFQECLMELSGKAGMNMEILDMGCGCGCLSLLAAKVFSDYHVRIVATDILPEAIATTKLNVQRFVRQAGSAQHPVFIEATDSGDLFQPVNEKRFDIIIFNAPWVTSPPKSRAEAAICDADQKLVHRFLIESPRHLKEGGHITLGYSDHSGPETLENLEEYIKEAGLKIENVYKRRTQSRRRMRKWETILVYDCIALDIGSIRPINHPVDQGET